jgi:hypothetical protein
MRGFGVQLVGGYDVWFFALGRRVIHARWAFRSPKVSLPNIEPAPDGFTIHRPLPIHNKGLRLDNRAALPLIVHANDLALHGEFLAFAGGGERLVERDVALAVDDAGRVEFGDAGDGRGALALVEGGYFLVGELEGEDDGVGGEDGEGGVEFLGVLLGLWWGERGGSGER